MRLIVVLVGCALAAPAAVVPFDIKGPGPGSIAVSSTADAALVSWKDKAGRPCTAQFSLDPARPLITSISVNGKMIISRAQPVYRASTGKRRGGFDQFFENSTWGTPLDVMIFRGSIGLNRLLVGSLAACVRPRIAPRPLCSEPRARSHKPATPATVSTESAAIQWSV